MDGVKGSVRPYRVITWIVLLEAIIMIKLIKAAGIFSLLMEAINVSKGTESYAFLMSSERTAIGRLDKKACSKQVLTM